MIKERKTILLVEDNPADARLLAELLSENRMHEFKVTWVDHFTEAARRIAEESFDAVLLDLSLPDANGLDTVKQMCTCAEELPIIVLTGTEDDFLAIEAVQAGAQDYLVKGQVDPGMLERAIRYSIERMRMRARLQFMATHDGLTGLPNRVLFQDRLNQAIQRAVRLCHDHSPITGPAVMLLDLDNFKTINDTLGHDQGDILLQMVAERLHSTIRRSDTVARMGGDEFTLIFENVNGCLDAETLAHKVQAVFAAPFVLENQEWEVTASIGISLFECNGKEVQSLLKYADIAMYKAKQKRNNFCFFSDC